MSAIGLAKLSRHAVAVGRAAAAHVETGTPGTFKATLAISGLSDERREELIAGLEQALGASRSAPVGDGKLRLTGWLTPGYSIQVGAAAVIGQWSQVLSEIGFAPSEMLAGAVEIEVVPADEPPPADGGQLHANEPAPPRVAVAVGRQVGRLLGDGFARRLTRAAHGTAVAFGEAYDRIAMADTGERSFAVLVRISQLDPAVADAMAAELTRRLDGAPERDAGDVILRVKANRVGMPLGALGLIVGRLATFIETLPPGATLEMLALELPADAAA